MRRPPRWAVHGVPDAHYPAVGAGRPDSLGKRPDGDRVIPPEGPGEAKSEWLIEFHNALGPLGYEGAWANLTTPVKKIARQSLSVD
jgi:hypothetical protein